MPMPPQVYSLAAVVLCLTSACTKQAARTDAAAKPAAPKRNAAESLGFASESSEGYLQNSPPPRPVSAADPPGNPPPAPKAAIGPAVADAKPIRRTLTAKDGRKVEAELLARSDSEVKFRRTADSTEFTFPLEKLSESDRAFIRDSKLPPLASR